MKTLPERSFRCIVTSPPYNLGKDYGNSVNDKKPMADYLQWIREVFLECKRVLEDDGSLFLNIGYSNAQPWIAMDVAQVLREDWILQNQFTWVKNISIGDISHGHFKPINSPRYANVTNEQVFHFTKTGKAPIHRLSIGVPFMHKSNLTSRSTGEARADVRCRGNTWFVRQESIQSRDKERGGHPATYPVELVELCLKLTFGSEKTGKVLDPFLGTGTTLVAAQNMGLVGTGIDINPEFLQYARSRMAPDTSP